MNLERCLGFHPWEKSEDVGPRTNHLSYSLNAREYLALIGLFGIFLIAFFCQEVSNWVNFGELNCLDRMLISMSLNFGLMMKLDFYFFVHELLGIMFSYTVVFVYTSGILLNLFLDIVNILKSCKMEDTEIYVGMKPVS